MICSSVIGTVQIILHCGPGFNLHCQRVRDARGLNWASSARSTSFAFSNFYNILRPIRSVA
jgi:hypothetical protein